MSNEKTALDALDWAIKRIESVSNEARQKAEPTEKYEPLEKVVITKDQYNLGLEAVALIRSIVNAYPSTNGRLGIIAPFYDFIEQYDKSLEEELTGEET